MSQDKYTITLPQGNYDGSRFAGRCDEYSIAIAAGSSARNMDISHLKFTRISAPNVDLSGLVAEKTSVITLFAPGAKLDGACFAGATLGMAGKFTAYRADSEDAFHTATSYEAGGSSGSR